MLTTTLVLICSLLLIVLAVLSFFSAERRAGPLVGIVVGLFGLLWWAYSRLSAPSSFGTSAGTLILFAAILVGVSLGIAAEGVFYSRRAPQLLDVLKPMLASPIVLLPLYGAVRTIPTYETADLIWWFLLGFQNGWFWKTVLQKVAPKLKTAAQ